MPSGAAKRQPPARVDCKWWLQGYCSRGKTCYFKHDEATFGAQNKPAKEVVEAPEPAAPAEEATDETPIVSPQGCTICYEDTPDTYGLLVNCDHAFCLACIRSWRSSAPANDSDDATVSKETSKTCPMCRSKSDFIIPSSIWPTAPQKEIITKGYLDRLKSIPCKYFEESIRDTAPAYEPKCPFTNHCHYLHIHPETGEPYTFKTESSGRARRRGRRAPIAVMDQRTMDQLIMIEMMVAGNEFEAMEAFGLSDDDHGYDYPWV